ncbi:Nitric oxide synthase-interacting protein like protein [Trachymyrmex cornetzi]|uniref:Nitric oxide synthase-interacting protein like protein n=1 Tax=Trachymyrmex cornetzi TaxID=471704 RepID=A0A151IRJ6_9HYME|nr:Nitric oxide synthase-interacting protein like protein [Trachymyrmex cornetzi]
MTRHARNCTAGAVYTYHEKKKDAAASSYGTNTQRVEKVSVKDFDCCCLTLQPCRNPVITKDGFFLDKEAILEYILTKKEQSQEQTANEELKKLQNYLKCEKTIVSSSTSDGDLVSNMKNDKDKMPPSYWIPSKTPGAMEISLQRLDKTIYCPVSGKPLKVKDLIPARYMCPIMHDVLGNSVLCSVIKTTGDVVTMECVEKLIKKDWINPLDNSKLTPSDIIPLQRGGTGYAFVNDSIEGRHERPVLQA